MTAYLLLRVCKFIGVALYAGGLVANFVASAQADRKRAVHAIASPGLLLTWVAGYLLSLRLDVPLTELWILGALASSLASQVALVRSVSRERATRLDLVAAVVPFLLVLVLMVFRPTWSSFQR